MTLDLAPQFVVYLAGPLLAAWTVVRAFGVSWRFFWIGFPAFFLSQIGVSLVGIAAALGAVALGLSVSFWTAVIGAIGAGVCEEYCRYFAFRYLLNRGYTLNWNAGLIYAIGHSGLETMLVGGGILLAILAVTFAPDQLSPELLEGLSSTTQLGLGKSLVLACERMFGGLIIHLAFTSLVVLALLRSRSAYLMGAIAWHAAHDMVFAARNPGAVAQQ